MLQPDQLSILEMLFGWSINCQDHAIYRLKVLFYNRVQSDLSYRNWRSPMSPELIRSRFWYTIVAIGRD